MSSKDLYGVLNVPRNADVATIQEAFRDLSLKLKANASAIPRDGFETSSEQNARKRRNYERYINIVEARDILTDAAKRRDYDEQQRRKKNQTSTPSKPKNSSKSSNPSEPSKASKPEKKNLPQSSAQEMRAKPATVSNLTLERLKRIDFDLNSTLSLLRGLAPRSRFSSSYAEYSEVVSLFRRLIAMNARVRGRVTEAAERLRNQDPDLAARVTYESAKAKASSHILRARRFVSELDLVFTRYEDHLILDILYSDLYVTFATFLKI
ncbi:hypothetical protein CIB48_g8760 [Xylaria polymorpha]|nr:hypothetical protein CIB48_g8760 [Xylaria polymorpha]